MNSTWLITSELANQRARKVLFTCVVYTNYIYKDDCEIEVFVESSKNGVIGQIVRQIHVACLMFTGQTNHLDVIYP